MHKLLPISVATVFLVLPVAAQADTVVRSIVSISNDVDCPFTASKFEDGAHDDHSGTVRTQIGVPIPEIPNGVTPPVVVDYGGLGRISVGYDVTSFYYGSVPDGDIRFSIDCPGLQPLTGSISTNTSDWPEIGRPDNANVAVGFDGYTAKSGGKTVGGSVKLEGDYEQGFAELPMVILEIASSDGQSINQISGTIAGVPFSFSGGQ